MKKKSVLKRKVLSVLLSVSMLLTVYVPGTLATMTYGADNSTLICEKTEHTHDDGCYQDEQVITCGLSEDDMHTHSEECYEIKKTLICGLEEHQHLAECYSSTVSNPIVEEEKDVQGESSLIIDETLVTEHINGCGDDCAAEGCECSCHQNAVPEATSCETCGSTQLDENGQIIHADTCMTLCTCGDELIINEDGTFTHLEDCPLFVEKITCPAVDFTNVAPFCPPVAGSGRYFSRLISRSNSKGDFDDKIGYSKKAKMNEDGTATITLEAFAKGSKYYTEVMTDIPTDFVLVLDQSGTMAYDFGTSGSALHALQLAAENFATQVTNRANKYNVNHRVAVVGFAGPVDDGNCELLTGTPSQYSELKQNPELYNTALQDMRFNFENVSTAIGNLTPRGGTDSGVGLEMAYDILRSNSAQIPAGEQRNRVVIMFTDGHSDSPQSSLTYSGYIKNLGATVYSVGIFNGADPKGEGEWYSQVINTDKQANKFMRDVSSNNGAIKDPGYYLSASDVDTLTSIFEQIADKIGQGGSGASIGAEAVVKDVISDQFELPENVQKSDIHLYTSAYQGDGTDYTSDSVWGNPTAVSVSDDNIYVDRNEGIVSVSGFDYAENWCGMDGDSYRGNKLIIQFNVKVREDFLGGNNVFTNEGAHLFKNADAEEPLLTFDKPQVNVPINDVTVTSGDKNVYLMSNLTAEQLKKGATVKVGDVELKLAEKNYGLEAWQYEYVNITVEVKDKDGNVITSGFNNLMEDTTYTISVKVSPKTDGTGADGTVAAEKEGMNTPAANINVFKPEITYKDSQIDLGHTVDYETENFVRVEWKHKADNETEILDTDVDMETTAPILNYGYTPTEGAFTQDTPVKAAVKIGETDITEYVLKFNHENCGFAGCKWNKEEGFMDTDCQFIVHIKPFDLTIHKTGVHDIDENQSFVFHVVCDEAGVDLTVVVNSGNNWSQTIKQLPVGTYTITEESGWSWRYTPDPGNKSVTPSKAQEEVTFDNTRAVENSHSKNRYGWKWLNGCAWCDNRWITGEVIQDQDN